MTSPVAIDLKLPIEMNGQRRTAAMSGNNRAFRRLGPRLAGGLVIVAIVQSPAPATALDAAQQQRIARVFAEFDRPNSPGCAMGAIRDGRFLYRRGYGAASLELGVPITPRSVFYVGSVSKQFTAASVILAAQQGLLSLDDDVRRFIPELPDYGHPVTLRQMLHHTSGLRDFEEPAAPAFANVHYLPTGVRHVSARAWQQKLLVPVNARMDVVGGELAPRARQGDTAFQCSHWAAAVQDSENVRQSFRNRSRQDQIFFYSCDFSSLDSTFSTDNSCAVQMSTCGRIIPINP